MNDLLNSYDSDINFWESNPIFKTVDCFKKIYDNDNSKKKSYSSTIMYAIFYIIDDVSSSNKFKNLIYEDRIALVKIDFLKDETFNIDNYKDICNFIRECLMSPTKRMYSNFKKELEDRDVYINDLKWEEQAELKDKMLTGTYKLYEMLDKIGKSLDKENTDIRDRGGAQPSSSDGSNM